MTAGRDTANAEALLRDAMELLGAIGVRKVGDATGRHNACNLRNRIDGFLQGAQLDRLRAADSQPLKTAAFDLVAHLIRQRTWSRETFGPGARIKGVCDHIRKELIEVERSNGDIREWIDVLILAFDGCWRSGEGPEEIIAAMVEKQTRNEARTWPDWRTVSNDKAIEHDRSKDEPLKTADGAQGDVKVVPIEPTRAMIEAGYTTATHTGTIGGGAPEPRDPIDILRDQWRRMVEAATPPPPSDAVAPVAMADDFRGDDAHLIECIRSLLSLDASGSLVPHGIGGHARKLLSAAAVRLAQPHAAVNPAASDAQLQIIDSWIAEATKAGLSLCAERLQAVKNILANTVASDAAEIETLRSANAALRALLDGVTNESKDMSETRAVIQDASGDYLRRRLNAALYDMKERAGIAHTLCYELSQKHPEVAELQDGGDLHQALHAVLAVDTPTARPLTAAPRDVTVDEAMVDRAWDAFNTCDPSSLWCKLEVALTAALTAPPNAVKTGEGVGS